MKVFRISSFHTLLYRKEYMMDLIKYDPFREFTNLSRQMDILMRYMWGETLESGKLVPAVDISETPEAIIVKADLPGIDENDISLTLSGDNLIIKGEKKSEKEEKGKHFNRVERSYGSFERVIVLPVSVEQDKISAHYKKGVLEISMPKKPELKQKEIKINVGS
jgi:HSP20 family protein